MRQSLSSWLICAVVQGLLMPPALCALARTGASARPDPHHGHPVHNKSHGTAVVHGSAHATLARQRRSAVSLDPAHLTTTALIDPVPAGKFPIPAPLKG